MKSKLNLYLLLLIVLALAACQKVINVDVGNTTPHIVIEGNLTNIKGTQTVSISTTVPYSNTNVYPPVTGALVSFTDELGNIHPLIEVKPGTYTIANYKGNPLEAYTLTVKSGGQTYTASSVMPLPVNLDSLSLTGESIGGKLIKTVGVTYQDPPGIANQYRFVMFVNNTQVPRIFVANDEYSDGRNITTLLYEDDIELQTGNVVNIEMQCIDPVVYNYWYNLSSQGGNTPQDSATPSNPVSNFDNGALGYFSAHTEQKKSFTVL